MTPFRTKDNNFCFHFPLHLHSFSCPELSPPLSPAEHQYLVPVLTHYASPKVSVQFAGQGAYPAGEPAWDHTGSLCSREIPLTSAQMQVANPRDRPKRIIKNYYFL